MKIVHKPIRTLVSAAVLGVLSAHAAHSAGFSLYTESSAAATGNFAAGIAAEAADASTGWFNPAGLALLGKQEAIFGAVGVLPSSKLTGSSTFTITNPPPIPSLSYVETFRDIEGGQNALVPSFHYALPLADSVAFGLSVVSPFGLSTDWGTSSPVRYQATFTELLTANVSPELGARVNDHFAVGAGLDLQFARVKFNQIVGAPPLFVPLDLNPNTADSLSYNSGNSFGVGFHAGVMALFNEEHTRLGLNYQSKMRHQFSGQSRLTGLLASPGLILLDGASLAAANPFAEYKNNDLTSNPVSLPDVLTLSAYQDLNEQFALLGSAVYTGWSSFNTIQLNNVAAPSISGLDAPIPTAVSQVRINKISPQNYSDVWRFAVGANYHVNPLLMLRAGAGYDATPTNNIDRDVRLPDASRWALSIGAHYQPRPSIGLDVGYTHLFADDPTVNRTDALGATASYTVNASAKVHADLVGAQLVWVIDPVAEVPTK